jgi:hypothetical protein
MLFIIDIYINSIFKLFDVIKTKAIGSPAGSRLCISNSLVWFIQRLCTRIWISEVSLFRATILIDSNHLTLERLTGAVCTARFACSSVGGEILENWRVCRHGSQPRQIAKLCTLCSEEKFEFLQWAICCTSAPHTCCFCLT